MRQLLSSSATICAMLAPLPALADLSALDVWDNWKSYMQDVGYQVDVGAQESVGSSLILRDIAMTMPSDEATMRATLSNLEFRELGDGSVEITMGSDLPMVISSDDSEEIDITMFMRQSGLVVTASGAPENITYDFSAQSVSLGFDQFIVDGENVEPEMDFAMTGISGQSNMQQSDGWSMNGFANVDAMTGTVDFEDPESGDQVSMLISIADIETKSNSRMSDSYDAANPATAFDGSLSATGSASMGNMSVNFSVEGEETFDLNAAAAAQTINFSLDEGSIAYDAMARGVIYGFSSPEMPFPPINVSIEETASAFEFPMTQSDEMRDFRMMFSLTNLATDEFLWSMFDPGQMLPRDPASMRVDISGALGWLVDIFDEDALDEFAEEEMPFELGSIAINNISLSIAGAALEAVGSFVFDNSDLTTFDGFPAPDGEVKVDIYGLNGLLDTAIAMGLLPEDQAMGTRMMLGAFARPGAGEDHLESTLEVNSDGSVYANGMQLQ